LASTLAVAVWSRPYGAALALVIGGSVHQFAMLLLLHFTHITTLVKAAQLWKEGVVVLLLALVLQQAFLRREPPTIHLLDLAIVMFMAWGTFYLAVPNAADDSNSLITKLFGLRLDAFALMAYFAGRGLALNRAHVRRLIVVFAVVVAVIAAIAAIEFAAPNAANTVLDSLGQQEFAQQLGDPTQTSSIRFNTLGGTVLPRASSLLLSDLGLAFYMLLGVPVIASMYFAFRSRRRQAICNVLLLLSLLATILTLTRSAWFAMVTILAAITLTSRHFRPAIVLALEGAVAAVVAAIFLHIPPSLISMMFASDEGSLQAHIGALQTSLDVIQQSPFGLGLGSAGPVSQKFAVAGGIINESWYFQIAAELGVAGMLLWAAIIVLFGVLAFRRYRQVSDPWLKVLCLTMVGATVGFAQVSFTLHAWSGLATSIIFWLLAGITIQAPAIERRDPFDATNSPQDAAAFAVPGGVRA